MWRTHGDADAGRKQRKSPLVLPKDPFDEDAGDFYTAVGRIREAEAPDIGEFLAASLGPDRDLDSALASTTHFDPTNGTVSDGDIVLTHAGGMR